MNRVLETKISQIWKRYSSLKQICEGGPKISSEIKLLEAYTYNAYTDLWNPDSLTGKV